MFKLSRMSCPAICYYSNVRYKATKKIGPKLTRLKFLKKEEKEVFGPLLETKKERAAREKLKTKVTASKINLNVENNNGDTDNTSECLWTLIAASPERVRILKKKQSKSSEEISKLPEENSEVIPIEKNSNDITKNIRINTEIKNEIVDITSINNASIIHTAKSDTDKWESPTILSLPPIDQKHYSLPGVTRILNESMSDEAKMILEKWKKKMILQLGEEGFAKYQKELLQDSKIMHSLIENTLKKEPINVPEHLQLTYRSISNVLKDIQDVRFIESHVVHPTLGYRGFIDCIALYKGNLCVIDWKKSEKLKTLDTMYDSPLQISAYIGALNADNNYPFKVKTGLLAIAYAHGQPPSVFELNATRLEFYWKEWLKRLEKYYAIRYSATP